MSIRLRLAVLVSVAMFALLLGGGALFVESLRSGLNRSLTETLRARADVVSTRLAPARGPLTQSELRRQHLQRSLDGTYAQLLTAQGRLVDYSRRFPDDPLLSPAQARYATRHELMFDTNIRLADPTTGERQPMRVLARRLGNTGDVLVIGLGRNVADAAVTSARDEFILFGGCVLLLAGPGAWLLTGAALRPVERMRLEVRDLDARTVATGLRVPRTHDEIARLAQTFNSLLARLHATLAREQALVADAGHELRSPLTVLKGELELARRPARTRDELAAAVEVAAEETDRLVRLTDDLLFLSSEDVDQHRGLPGAPFDLVAVAAQAVASAAGPASRNHVYVQVEAAGPLLVCGDPDWIRRAIDNLLTNAVRHAPPGTTVTVVAGADDTRVHLTVLDEGLGFPPGFLPVAFDRFTRADDARMRGEGTGLGLSIVASIAARHGGSAWATNRPDGGAEVGLSWPRGRDVVAGPVPVTRRPAG